MEVMFAGR